MENENMAIINRQELLKFMALFYKENGFKISYIDPKENIRKDSISSVKAYKEPTGELIDPTCFDFLNISGIGAFSGVNKYNKRFHYRCIDIDNCSDTKILELLLEAMELDLSYPWIVKSGSNHGYHIWVEMHEKFPIEFEPSLDENQNILFTKYGIIKYEIPNSDTTIELRWNSHVVLPPSMHPNGGYYKFLNGELPWGTPRTVSAYELLSRLNTIAKSEVKQLFKRIDIKYEDSRHEFFHPLILFVDIETDGLAKNPKNLDFQDLDNWPHIVQFGAVACNANTREILLRESFIIKPENYTISKDSEKIHGISQSIALENGLNRSSAIKHIYELLNSVDYVVCHNTDFDYNVLKCEIIRLNKDDNHLFWNNKMAKQKIICTMKSAINICKLTPMYNGEYKFPKLQELHAFLFGCGFKNSHDAINDVYATHDCFWKMREMEIINFEGQPNDLSHCWGTKEWKEKEFLKLAEHEDGCEYSNDLPY